LNWNSRFFAVYYFGSMKQKTSITLDKGLLQRLDRLIGSGGNRSAVMEKALEAYLTDEERRQREARDLEILNRDAAKLNREAKDVLGYQEDA
jgi:metal-responsive CopG/Arc/MetJ family transcriptional regulator